jgi:DNA-binding NarL/FixJ family response regulator
VTRDATVVLADDHAVTRAGVRLAIEGSGFVIVAEAGTADEAIEEAVRHRPALCLLDLYMPGGGLDAAREIHRAVPETKLVILTVSANEHDLLEALTAGASGYLLKETAAARLPAALRGVLAGEAAVPRAALGALIDALRALEGRERRGRRFLPRRQGGETELTTREWEVLRLIGEHMPTTVVARRLGISEITVRRHMSSVMQKLGVPDRESAVEMLERSQE